MTTLERASRAIGNSSSAASRLEKTLKNVPLTYFERVQSLPSALEAILKKLRSNGIVQQKVTTEDSGNIVTKTWYQPELPLA